VTVLEQKLNELKERLFVMAGIAEGMVADSVKSLVEHDPALAEKVVGVDEDRVNHLEIEIEDAAINLMALYQPEASNLRAIAMIIKINNDLERLGDHAVNIAEAAQYLIPRPAVKPLIDLPRMSEFSITMLKDALDSFTRADADLARSVCGRDSVVDSLKDRILRELVTYMTTDAATIDRAMKLMMVALNLERIADHATNIAEDVIYIVRGEVIKHGKGEPQCPPAEAST
jgi:phosphate transport system protein